MYESHEEHHFPRTTHRNLPGSCLPARHPLEKGVSVSSISVNPQHTFLHRVHERPKRFLQEWMGAQAHIHHVSYHMKNPPVERALTRSEFQQLLQGLGIPEDDTFIGEQFGYGATTHPSGDRLIFIWEAHTEYYSYQFWHIPSASRPPLQFGPLDYPGFQFPLSPLGLRINALDILVRPETAWSADTIRMLLPGPRVYGSRLFGEDLSVFTSFTPDDEGRERYLVTAPAKESLQLHMLQIVDGIAKMENYYHLILLPLPAFSKAVDHIHAIERTHLAQRSVVTEQLPTATAPALNAWVKELSTGFLEVSRLSESMRYKLSAAIPYMSILKTTVQSFQETSHSPFRPFSDYVFTRVSGVADGYQELLQRIAALQNDFQSLVTIIRTRADLLLQEQNVQLLRHMDQTTTKQTVLQHTVEALSVIVIAYYLTGLASYVWKALQHRGWLEDDALIAGWTVPIAVGLSFLLIWIGRKVIARHLRQLATHQD